MEKLCTKYNIKKTNILTHQPASNGLPETHRIIFDFQKDHWDECISDVHNVSLVISSIHSTTGDTPFYA